MQTPKETRDVATSVHDRNDRSRESANEAARVAANGTTRALLLINGGASVAMLGFMASTTSGDGRLLDHLGTLLDSTELFAFGVATSCLTTFFAYIVNYCHGSAASFVRYTWTYPYIEETDKSKKWLAIANVFHVFALFSGIASLALFCLGVWRLSQISLS